MASEAAGGSDSEGFTHNICGYWGLLGPARPSLSWVGSKFLNGLIHGLLSAPFYTTPFYPKTRPKQGLIKAYLDLILGWGW